MTPYEENIVKAFKDACARNAKEGLEGASPAEVTHLLADRDLLSGLDTVIDIERLMRELRNLGRL